MNAFGMASYYCYVRLLAAMRRAAMPTGQQFQLTSQGEGTIWAAGYY
jgi:hypothetical protein